MEFSAKLSTEATRSPEMAMQMQEAITKQMDGFDEIAKQINGGDLLGALRRWRRSRNRSR